MTASNGYGRDARVRSASRASYGPPAFPILSFRYSNAQATSSSLPSLSSSLLFSLPPPPLLFPAQIDSSTAPAGRLPPSPWVSSQTGHPSDSFLLWYLFLDSSSVLASLMSAVHARLFSPPSFVRTFFPLCCWDRIGKESLKAGDHIYSWRAAWVYAHHGEVIRIVLYCSYYAYYSVVFKL